MKYLLVLISSLSIAASAMAQNDLDKADKCYNNKDYSCALPLYQSGYSQALYGQGLKYMVEFRTGYCYAQLNQLKEAKIWFLKSIATKSDYGYSWWNLANHLYNEKKYDSAAVCYQKAYQYLEKQEDKDNMLYWSGWSYFHSGKYTESAREYQKIKNRTDKYRLLDVYLSELFFRLNRYDSAVAYGLKAMEYIKPGDSTYALMLYDLGKAYRKQKDFSNSLATLEKGLGAASKYTGSLEWELGLLYNDMKEYRKSIEHYQKALSFYKSDSADTRVLLENIVKNSRKLNDPPALVKALQNLLPYSASKQDHYKEIARLQYGKLNQPKEAVKTADASLLHLAKEKDSTGFLIKSHKAWLLSLKGLISLRVKDSTGAIRYFTEALRYNSADATANLLMGDIFWKRDKPEEYKKYYSASYLYSIDSSLFHSMDMARAFGRQAHVRHFHYNYKPADIKSTIESALKYDSLQKEAVYLWAVCLKDHYSLGTYRDKCLGLLQQGIKKYAGDKKYVSDLYNAKGVLLDTKKDTAGSLKAFETGIKIYPGNLSVWGNLLAFHQRLKNEQAGLVSAEKLLAQLKSSKQKDNKNICQALIYKGDFFWRMEQKEDAKKAWQEALVWDPENSTAKERAKL